VISQSYIRERLVTIEAATAPPKGEKGIEPPAFFVGDKAGARRVADDHASGRLAWRKAHQFAKIGLKALERGEVELATAAWRQAESMAAAAEARRSRKKPRAALITSAKLRGRKKETEERNKRLSDAVAAQEALGLTGSAAVAAAKRADPTLSAEIKGLGRAAIRKSLREARKTKRN
jgi:hypothetical protein